MIGPYTSVRPYTWCSSAPSASICAIVAGAGGAPAVVTTTRCGNATVSGWFTKPMSTVGAAQKCVTPSSCTPALMPTASTLRRQTCVAPAAVTAHGKHQPLQWNIGNVHR